MLLHSCSMLARDFFLCNVVEIWTVLARHLQQPVIPDEKYCRKVTRCFSDDIRSTRCFVVQCCLEPLGQYCIWFFLYNVLPGVLRQHCTGRASRILSNQSYANTFETTLHKEITCAVLAQSAQSSFRRKVTYTIHLLFIYYNSFLMLTCQLFYNNPSYFKKVKWQHDN